MPRGGVVVRRLVLGGPPVRPNSRSLRFVFSFVRDGTVVFFLPEVLLLERGVFCILPSPIILLAPPRHRIEAVRRSPRKITNRRCIRLARIAALVKRILVGVGVKVANTRRDGCTALIEGETVARRILCGKGGQLRRVNGLGLASSGHVG